jgi:hypothetical protein
MTWHAEKLADRRAKYIDRKQSDAVARRAQEILAADPSMGLGKARQVAFKKLADRLTREWQ